MKTILVIMETETELYNVVIIIIQIAYSLTILSVTA